MWNDNITIIISVIALLISLIDVLRNYKKDYSNLLCEIKDIKAREKELYKMKVEIKNLELELGEKYIKQLRDNTIKVYLKKLSEMINQIYPKSNCTISIKLINKSDEKNPLESEVVTWVSYPEKNHNIKMNYTIKDNTDFSSIVNDKKEYFFVSDLKEYHAISKYTNIDHHFMEKYNTSIVVPIQNAKGNIEIIGFLCVNSHKKLGNVKKNRAMVDIIKATTSIIYDYLKENKLSKEAIFIKK